MAQPVDRRPRQEEVDTLLRNAELRDQLEPYRDEAITWLNLGHHPTAVENEYLESMLAWERAPMLPVADWFHPPLALSPHDTLTDEALHELLWHTIHKLFAQRIILEFTDHLGDRQLYNVIARDILPSVEKKLDQPPRYLHWDCAGASNDIDLWLRHYATPFERREWADENCLPLPPHEPPRHRRDLPKAPI